MLLPVEGRNAVRVPPNSTLLSAFHDKHIKLRRRKEMETILKLTDLTKKYGNKVVVDNLNIEIQKGEIFGLLGPNGAGKSTTMNMICNIVRPTLGSVEFMGKDFRKNKKELSRHLGYIPQDLAIHGRLKAWENVELFTSLYGIKGKELKERIDESLEYVGLLDRRNDYAKTFSGGMKRRLNIACGIAHKPELIFFDEPTVAVDPQSRNAILEGIRKMNEQGSTVIYTSHYMEEVEELCSRIVIMDHGKNEAEGTSQSLKSSLRNRETIRINMPVHEKELLDQIRNINHVYDVRIDEEDVIIKCDGGEHNLVHILNFLSEKQLPFGRVTTELPTLNDVFLEITGKELRD